MINFVNTSYEFDTKVDGKIQEGVKKLQAISKYDIVQVILFNKDKDIGETAFKSISNAARELSIGGCYKIDTINKSILNLLIENKQIVILNKDSEEEEFSALNNETKSEIYIPVITEKVNKNDVIGCIYFGSLEEDSNLKMDGYYLEKNEEFKKELEEVIKNTYIFYKSISTRKKIIDNFDKYFELLKTKNPYILYHSYNVASFCYEIATELNMTEHDKEKLYLAAMFHDIGKIMIDSKILNKNGELNTEQSAEMKKHSIYGYRILKDLLYNVDGFEDIPYIVSCIHENCDGSGYPNNLSIDDIPYESRIIRVADEVDNMISPMSYKKSLSIRQAVSELKKGKKKEFDAEAVDAIVKTLSKKINNTNKILEPIMPSNISICTQSEIFDVSGTLVKEEDYYCFKAPAFDFKKIKATDIKECYIYIEKNKDMLDYSVKIEKIEDDRIYIIIEENAETKGTFSVMWDFDAVVFVSPKEALNLNVTKIDATSLTFKVSEDELDSLKKCNGGVYKIILKLGEGELVPIMGKIVNEVRIPNGFYIYVKFINTSERIQDQIYKFMFKKQIELRRALAEEQSN